MLGVTCPMCRGRLLHSSLLYLVPHTMTWRSASTVNLGGEELEVIRYPVGKQRAFLKAKESKKRKGKVISLARPGKLLISANERKFNLYTNEFPTKFEPPTLASQSWTSRNSPGRYFTIHPTRENPSLPTTENSECRFEDLGLSQTLAESLSNIGIASPTSIQKKVIPLILEGLNVMLAAETGSGKTYGYLLPIVHSIVRMTQETHGQGPSALILTPSKELSSQVLRMSNELNLPVRIGNLDDIWTEKRKDVVKTADVIIGTPVLALAALRRRFISLNKIKFAVVDECDTLLDVSFGKYVCSILGRMNICKGVSKPLLEENEAQLILCSATFPNYAGKTLKDVISISDFSAVSTGYMHRISSHVTHKFLRVRPSEKLSALIHILQESQKNEGLTMIFCNKKDVVYWLAKELMFHGFLADKGYSGDSKEERKATVHQAQSGEARVLVCTDLLSRGLDTQKTSHVINYDFPLAASDYIHRSGRVGRVGQDGSGVVTNLICRKWEIPLVMKIEEAARRRERVEGVDANIKSYHNQRWEDKWQAMETSIEDDAE